MSLRSLADQHFNARRLLAMTATAELTGLWRENVSSSNIYRSWRSVIPQASEKLSEYQARAAADGQQYMTATLLDAGMEPEGPSLEPAGFAGFTYPLDGVPARMLEESLEYPAYRALHGLRVGESSDRALAAGLDSLVRTGSTAVADAGRNADGVAFATEPKVRGYVRQTEPDACARCIILAGRRYRTNDGFLRHPNCLCEHVPIIAGGEPASHQDVYELFDALSESEQDRIFTQAGAQAIRDGADMYQVVNARRGMSTTEGGSLATSEGMTRTRSGGYRGAAGQIMQRNNVRGARMMPEEIYKRVSHLPDGDHRDRLIRDQLERYGYILPGRQDTDGVLQPQLSGWYGASASERRAALRQGL